jgi:ribosomal protein L7/L12
MNDLKLIDVFAVYGDSENANRGMLIGVYEEEEHANIAVIGRGCVNNSNVPYAIASGERGNGTIEKKKAIKINNEIYLLEVDHLIKLNTELIADKRVSSCIGEEKQTYFKVKLTYVGEIIELMKFIRVETGMDLLEVKRICDKARIEGSAMIEPFHGNLNNEITKEEFIRWKQELELRQIAKIEAV